MAEQEKVEGETPETSEAVETPTKPAKTEKPEKPARPAAETDADDDEFSKLSVEDLRKRAREQRDHIGSLNKENAERRTKLAAFEKAQQEAEDAKLSEMDRLKKAADESRTAHATTAAALQQERIERAVELAAYALDFEDPEDAMRFIDLKKVKVEEDGKVDRESVKKELERVLKVKPYLAVQQKETAKPKVGGTPSHRNSPPPPAEKPALPRRSVF